MVDEYRKALVRQLMTPAWGVAAVNWKKVVLARDDYVFRGGYVDKGQVEKAVDDDVAWLAAHPVRRDDPEAQARRAQYLSRRREFKETVRRRIRDIAARQGLSDEDIKPALSLRHQRLGEFAVKHGVNLEWLLDNPEHPFSP